MWPDEDERVALVERSAAAFGPGRQNGPAESRQRTLLSTVLVPDLAASAAAAGNDSESRAD